MKNRRGAAWMMAGAWVALFAQVADAGVSLSVRLGEKASGGPLSGRLVVALAREDAKIPVGTPMIDAPFWHDWQPMFGMNVAELAPGGVVRVGDDAEASMGVVSSLKPGKYRGAAWLIASRETSDWKQTAGNVYSREVDVVVDEKKETSVELVLSEVTSGREWPTKEAEGLGVELVEIKSAVLSAFHGRAVMLRAGVVPPLEFDAGRKYAAVYEVPGFGGDHLGALDAAKMRAQRPGDVAKESFWIVLDPESPNGHTLFADSANNGPVGTALVTELIPAIEKRFPALRAESRARLLRGHSSGGWSVLWLALNYPETFGHAWTSAPDPVDFRGFQMVDIYSATSMYLVGEKPTASFRRDGKMVMSVEQENAGERVLGPDQTSGQQWASWQAVFGPRVGEQGWGKGHPAALYDARTGMIDRGVAEQYRGYDLGEWVRANPKFRSMIFRDRVRLVVGDQDSFYLNVGVALLEEELKKHGSTEMITIVPGADHGSVHGSAAVRGFDREMLEFILKGNVPDGAGAGGVPADAGGAGKPGR